MLGRTGVICALGAALVACSSGNPPACTTVETACAPLYAPTYANVYSQTIARSCSGSRSACHAPGGDGNLDLSSADRAYASLTAGYIEPANASCSELIVRVHGVGEDYLMPPGAPLSDAERCALVQWVEAGALEVEP